MKIKTDLTTQTDDPANYFWPVERSEITFLGESYLRLILDYSDLGSSKVLPNNSSAFRTLMPKLLSELLSVSQGEMLVQRANKQNRVLVIPKDAYFWRALLDNKNIVENKFVRSLEIGVPKRSLWKSFVRPFRVLIPPSEVKYTYQKNVFRYKYFNQIDFNNCIVCTSLSPLALAHAERLNEKVYFCEVQEWFYPPQPGDLLEEKTYLSSDQIHLEFIDDADACFRQLGVRFSDISRSYIKQWLRDTT